MTTLRDAAQAVLDDFEAVIREADAPPGGMHVPFFGVFASATRLPSLMKGIRWHARQLRTALSSPPSPPEPRAIELLRELVTRALADLEASAETAGLLPEQETEWPKGYDFDALEKAQEEDCAARIALQAQLQAASEFLASHPEAK